METLQSCSLSRVALFIPISQIIWQLSYPLHSQLVGVFI